MRPFIGFINEFGRVDPRVEGVGQSKGGVVV